MTPGRGLLAVVGTALVTLALVGASAVPLPYRRQDGARLRLSWSARPERLEVCRVRSEEEQAKLEEHMREQLSCEGKFASYLLRVEVDGVMVDTALVRGAGLRHDRPLYLLREMPIPIGPHRLRVSLTRRETPSAASATPLPRGPGVDTGVFAGRAQREIVERARRTTAAIPAQLSLDTVVRFVPQRVALVTFDAERHRLTLHEERDPR